MMESVVESIGNEFLQCIDKFSTLGICLVLGVKQKLALATGRIGWKKFKELSSFPTMRGLSLHTKDMKCNTV